MEETLDVVIESADWEAMDLHALAQRAMQAVLRHLRLPATCRADLLAADDARIAKLNAAFREKNSATNVLSWPSVDLAAEHPGGQPALPEPDFPGEPPFLGDLALAWETCHREAREAGRSVAAHVTHLVVHGLLHLLGYDHVHDDDAALMERLEIEILAKLGVPNPY